MGKTRDHRHRRRGGCDGGALTSFLSPSASSSSSDFEFTVSLSPSSGRSACPADELFYKGQLLPLHLSPRISMVRTLLLASSTTASRDSNGSSSSSSDATTTTSRDSNGSSSSSSFSAAGLHLLFPPDCDSSRPSSVTEEDGPRPASAPRRPNYFSSFATRFSSVFLHRGSKKDPSDEIPAPPPPPPKKSPTNTTAREVFKKLYVKKVKPLYEKLSLLQQKQNQPSPQQQNQTSQKKNFSFSIRRDGRKCDGGSGGVGRMGMMYSHTHSFSGNLRCPRRKKCAGSCPSSMRSSPSHSGLLYGGGGLISDPQAALSPASSSSMEELQSAIQGAITHCKSTMMNQAARQKAAAVVVVAVGGP